MIHKQHIPGCDSVRVTFELPSCIWADRIFVVGEFNEWNHTATRMLQGRDGVWRVTLELDAGRQYQFRYLIDGKWQSDWHADGSMQNQFGSDNSVVDTRHLNVRVTGPVGGSLLHEEAAALAGDQHKLALPHRKSLRAA